MAPLLTTGARIAKGFDFLGYSFEPKGLSIAPKTLANFLERITQLYEQGATVRRIGKYVRNWWGWVRAGVDKVMIIPIDMLLHHSFMKKPPPSLRLSYNPTPFSPEPLYTLGLYSRDHFIE